jgi:hypothetical protein
VRLPSSTAQVKASQTVFSSASLVAGTLYQPLMLFFPKAAPFVQWLARTLPDKKLLQVSQVGVSCVYKSRQNDVRMLVHA